MGDTAAAEAWYGRAERLAAERPEPFNRQWTQFRLDHRRAVPQTRALLEEEIRTRPDVYGWDLLAWARYLDGDVAEGRMTDAERLLQAARTTNPYFHAW